MFDITKRKQFKTVGELKEILKDIPDKTEVCVCGDPECWLHAEYDGSVVSFDYNDLDDEYCDDVALVEYAKNEYMKNDLVMSELLRNEEFAKLSGSDKSYLLQWAGED